MPLIHFYYNTDNDFAMEEACHGVPMTITFANKTDISSPKCPVSYENNLNCTWIIKASKWNRIELTIDSHDRGEIEKKYGISIFKII